MLSINLQLVWLFILPIPIACIAWTVTHEEVFKEPIGYCVKKSKSCQHLLQRKFFYLFTCEYCFSHYVTLFFIIVTNYRLLMPDWSGFLIAWFSLVWIANMYMSLMGIIRQDIKKEKATIKILESENTVASDLLKD
jgi:hypothetical protein